MNRRLASALSIVLPRGLLAAMVLTVCPAAAFAQTDGAAAPANGGKPSKALPSWAKKGGPLPQPAAPPPPPPPPPPPADPAAQAEATAKTEARKHFDQGLALFDAGSLQAALPEFMLSLSIYPTRAATKNAALCLRRLGRFDEALEMNEALLAFPEVSGEEKALANKELSELRPVVGSIVIEGIQPGATISVDGKPRGTTPLKGPLYVPVGTRVVRIYKAGFETFESRVESLGGKTASLRAVLAPLELAGWLSVDEASGYNVDVLLDGAVVGKTPWRGLIKTGEHLVVLRGDKGLGTQPARIDVRPSEVTSMLLIAEQLASDLRVESKTKEGKIFVDGVFVGQGSWEGSVRTGSHRVTVEADGFVTEERRIDVGPGKHETVTLAIAPKPPVDFWTLHAPFVEIGAIMRLFPSYGGDISSCTDGCAPGLGLGGGGMARLGIMLGPNWSVGAEIGGFFSQQTVENHSVNYKPVGFTDSTPGKVTDTLALRGVMFGGTIGAHFGDRFPFSVKLGAGGFFGSVRDKRVNSEDFKLRGDPDATSAMNPSPSPGTFEVNVSQSQPATGFYVAPEVRFGMRVKPQLDISASLGALLIVLPSPPSWQPKAAYVRALSDGLVTFNEETLSGTTIFGITPGLVATYRFF